MAIFKNRENIASGGGGFGGGGGTASEVLFDNKRTDLDSTTVQTVITEINDKTNKNDNQLKSMNQEIREKFNTLNGYLVVGYVDITDN